MALIRQDSGCKVGWLTYDNEAEAQARAVKARKDAAGMEQRGYDFGFQIPGEVQQVRKDGELIEEWMVTIP